MNIKSKSIRVKFSHMNVNEIENFMTVLSNTVSDSQF
jgi:hypothetical protein